MPKILTQGQVDQFWKDGCIFSDPRDERAGRARNPRPARSIREENRWPVEGRPAAQVAPALLVLGDLVRHDKVVDAIEDLYGANILCWTSNFFIKEANNPAFVSWHQDSTYWGTRPPRCRDRVDRIHREQQGQRRDGVHAGHPHQRPRSRTGIRSRRTISSRGQEVAVDVDESQSVTIELKPGEMSLHHVRLVHGSPPNPSSDRRIGFAIRYIPTSVGQVAGEDSATLVRGVDDYHHFELEPRPASDMDPSFVALHRRITERNAQILYRGTQVKSYNDPSALPERGA